MEMGRQRPSRLATQEVREALDPQTVEEGPAGLEVQARLARLTL